MDDCLTIIVDFVAVLETGSPSSLWLLLLSSKIWRKRLQDRAKVAVDSILARLSVRLGLTGFSWPLLTVTTQQTHSTSSPLPPLVDRPADAAWLIGLRKLVLRQIDVSSLHALGRACGHLCTQLEEFFLIDSPILTWSAASPLFGGGSDPAPRFAPNLKHFAADQYLDSWFFIGIICLHPHLVLLGLPDPSQAPLPSSGWYSDWLKEREHDLGYSTLTLNETICFEQIGLLERGKNLARKFKHTVPSRLIIVYRPLQPGGMNLNQAPAPETIGNIRSMFAPATWHSSWNVLITRNFGAKIEFSYLTKLYDSMHTAAVVGNVSFRSTAPTKIWSILWHYNSRQHDQDTSPTRALTRPTLLIALLIQELLFVQFGMAYTIREENDLLYYQRFVTNTTAHPTNDDLRTLPFLCYRTNQGALALPVGAFQAAATAMATIYGRISNHALPTPFLILVTNGRRYKFFVIRLTPGLWYSVINNVAIVAASAAVPWIELDFDVLADRKNIVQILALFFTWCGRHAHII